MQVRDYMTANVETIGADRDYMEAFRLMQTRKFHHLPVVDADGHLVGILAERDLLIASMHYLQTPIEVSEIMTRTVMTIGADTPISDAATLMVKHAIGGLPVMDDRNEIIGIITETDVFRAFVSLLASGKPIPPPSNAK